MLFVVVVFKILSVLQSPGSSLDFILRQCVIVLHLFLPKHKSRFSGLCVLPKIVST